MDNNRKLAHIVSYYLSRFDRKALHNLGYRSFNEAFKESARHLNVKPNYLKLNRDEFDVAHPHRKGWRNRPMAPSISNTINALQDLVEPALRSIFLDILTKRKEFKMPEDFETLVSIISEEKKKKQKRHYVPRNITGKKAEEIFIEWFRSGQEILPVGKDFIDMRDYGCGYDFQLIISNKQVCAIEVKGFSDDDGGIILTSKEWEVAAKMKENYYLALISNTYNQPLVTIINNPFETFSPKRSIQKVIQISWILPQKEVRQLISRYKL